jgi:hypothetical protein
MEMYLDETFIPKTEFGKKLKEMVENGEHCDGNIYWLIDQVEKIEEIKTGVDNILYSKYEECGTPQQVNETGFTKGHYLIEEITEEIERLFTMTFI